MPHFADMLLAACATKQSRVVVGLDPHFALLPPSLTTQARQATAPQVRRVAAAEAIMAFNREILPAVADKVAAVKPQLAFYEQWGPAGIKAYEDTVALAHELGLLVIADAKRNDIGSTAEAYAAAFLGRAANDASAAPIPSEQPDPWEADAITVNPYFGMDGITPFLQRWPRGKGLFALLRTSNSSAPQVQDIPTAGGGKVYTQLAELISGWGEESVGACGYSALGAVVGATYPEDMQALRRVMPHTLFLVPGYGAQGGDAASVAAAFKPDGFGAVINTSRQVLFAYRDMNDQEHFALCARRAAEETRQAINAVLL